MTPEEVATAMPQLEAHVAWGLLAFPIVRVAGTKRPKYKGWQTKVWDLGVLGAELRYPNVMGYGLTLPRSDPRRLVDLDLDDGGEGLQPGQIPWQDRLAAIEAEHGPLPVTKTTLTPSGGQHRWFLWPEGAPLPDGSWHGFTVRRLHGGKNFVAGPGSVAPDGTVYTIETPGTPIATMPVDLARSGTKDRGGVAAGDMTVRAPYGLPETIDYGSCHLEVCRYTLSLWNRRHSLAEIWTLTLHELGPKLTTPHTEEHLREHFDSAVKDLPAKVPRDEHGYVIQPAITVDTGHNGRATPADVTGQVGMDAADLLALDLPPLRMIVPELLAEGTTVLASPPKVGKSCLVYQIVTEVALGGAFLGRRVEPGAALYLALEDGQRRGQDRLRTALAGRTMPRGRLEVQWSSRRIGEGLEGDLAAWLDAHPDAAVVAIDTLQRARPPSNGRRNAYEVDVEDLGRIQQVFRDRRVALVIVHHSRKEAGDDFLASVSGTYGISGTADSVVVIRRKRLEAFGTIVATGRDIPETEISARFDGMLWHEAPQVLSAASFERTEVYRVIEADGPIFATAIADRLGLSRTSVQGIVSRLVDAGAVARVAKGYIVAGGIVLEPCPRAGNRNDSSDSDSHSSHAGYLREGTSPGTDLVAIARGIFGVPEPVIEGGH